MEPWQILITGIIYIIIKIIDEKSTLKKMDKINQIYPNSTIKESGDFIKKTKIKYFFFIVKTIKLDLFARGGGFPFNSRIITSSLQQSQQFLLLVVCSYNALRLRLQFL